MPSTTTTDRVTLPPLEGEHPARYEARTQYILAGADRSLSAVSRKLAKSLPLIKRWSTEDNWTDLARDYDQTVYTLAAQGQADAYRADLADYRKRYGDMGKSLYQSAVKMVIKINKTLDNPQVEVGPNSLLTALNAVRTAADLEALALRVEHVLGQMDNAEPRHE